MAQLEDDFYVVLTPTAHSGLPINGSRPVSEFKAEKITRKKPFTNRNQIAVKLKLRLDSSIFDSIIPNVEIELGAKDLFINTQVEVLAQEPEPDRYEQTGE